MLNPNPKFKNKNKSEKENKIKKQSLLFAILIIQLMEEIDKEHQKIRTRPNKFRGSTRIYSTIHTFVQQNLRDYQNRENGIMKSIY